MTKPVIFTISAVWDADASVWSGHCDDIPATADASTLDDLLEKILYGARSIAGQSPGVGRESLFLQIRAQLLLQIWPCELRNLSIARCGNHPAADIALASDEEF
jgi:hypothetical protein